MTSIIIFNFERIHSSRALKRCFGKKVLWNSIRTHRLSKKLAWPLSNCALWEQNPNSYTLSGATASRRPPRSRLNPGRAARTLPLTWPLVGPWSGPCACPSWRSVAAQAAAAMEEQVATVPSKRVETLDATAPKGWARGSPRPMDGGLAGGRGRGRLGPWPGRGPGPRTPRRRALGRAADGPSRTHAASGAASASFTASPRRAATPRGVRPPPWGPRRAGPASWPRPRPRPGGSSWGVRCPRSALRLRTGLLLNRGKWSDRKTRCGGVYTNRLSAGPLGLFPAHPPRGRDASKTLLQVYAIKDAPGMGSG